MRTKTLLMTAAALAVGVVSSQAQGTVYSQNVVGYVNLSVPAGASQMVANQLDSGSNTLNNVFQSGMVSEGTFLLEWNGAGYNTYEYYNCSDSSLSEAGWYNTAGTVLVGATNYLQPGQGVFLHNASSSAITVPTVGQVIQGTNYYSVQAGSQIYSVPQPLAGLPLDNPQVNFPMTSEGTFYLTWTGTGYNTYEYYNCSDSSLSKPGFYNTAGTIYEETNTAIWPQAGGSFFVHSAAASTWTNVFEVQ